MIASYFIFSSWIFQVPPLFLFWDPACYRLESAAANREGESVSYCIYPQTGTECPHQPFWGMMKDSIQCRELDSTMYGGVDFFRLYQLRCYRQQ